MQNVDMTALVPFLADKPNAVAALGARGIAPEAFEVMRRTIWPSAKNVDSIMLAIDYCKARNLDPLKRPVHIVPMYDKRANDGRGAMVDTVWPGIAEIRTTAHRTGEYVGLSAPEFGKMITRKFAERDKDGNAVKHESLRFPEWCRVTVKRRNKDGLIGEFTAEVHWLEAYASESHHSDIPNHMWQKRVHGQLEKCTEVAALRKAFPEELGNVYSAEEMEYKTLDDNSRDRHTSLHVIAPPAPTRASIAVAEIVTGHTAEETVTLEPATPLEIIQQIERMTNAANIENYIEEVLPIDAKAGNFSDDDITAIQLAARDQISAL